MSVLLGGIVCLRGFQGGIIEGGVTKNGGLRFEYGVIALLFPSTRWTETRVPILAKPTYFSGYSGRGRRNSFTDKRF